MEILAVVIGYLLGVAPFVTPKIVTLIQNRVGKIKEEKTENEALDIFNEWLNGPQDDEKEKVNQEDIYNEYVTGKVTPKGD